MLVGGCISRYLGPTRLERLRLQLFVLGVRALLYRAISLLKYPPADYLGLVSCLTLPETCLRGVAHARQLT